MEKPLALIVDDEEDNLILLEKRLKVSDFNTITARDGDEAVEQAFKYLPSIILLDIMMPKKDGYEVLKILRENPKTREIPVILLTAKAETPDKVKGLQLGAVDYVTKPFDFKELLARIRSRLETKQVVEEKIKAEKLVALSTMMMGVAHEVRNPLVVIGGFSKKLLSMTTKDDPRYKYILAIEQEVSRLEKMIRDIYDFKTLKINRNEVVSINDCITTILTRFRETLSKSNITLSQHLHSHDVRIFMDREKFEKAIENIIKNAVEAMPKGGFLTISSKKTDNTFVIEITDTGVGIKEEEIKYIFDPFFTSKMEGTGLGLTISAKIIEEHNGKIVIKSTRDVGTTAIIELNLD